MLKYTPGSASGSGLDALFNSVDARFLYNSSGIGYDDPNNDVAVGPWYLDFKNNVKTDLPDFLSNNIVPLNPFTASSSPSQNLRELMINNIPPIPLPGTGKYYAGALRFNESTQIATIDALSQVVFLKEPTPIVWTDSSGSRSLPITYVKGQGGDVSLSFGGSNHATPTTIAYMFINSTTAYNLTETIDTQLLAESASDKWTSLASNSPVIQLLYKSMQLDADDAYTYNLTAAGQTTSPMLNTFSTIAITPGYGIASTNGGQRLPYRQRHSVHSTMGITIST